MPRFAVSREPDDSSGVLRTSIGGNWAMGYYLVFRGDPAKVLEMLEEVVEEARRALSAGDYADSRGTLQG